MCPSFWMIHVYQRWWHIMGGWWREGQSTHSHGLCTEQHGKYLIRYIPESKRAHTLQCTNYRHCSWLSNPAPGGWMGRLRWRSSPHHLPTISSRWLQKHLVATPFHCPAEDAEGSAGLRNWGKSRVKCPIVHRKFGGHKGLYHGGWSFSLEKLGHRWSQSHHFRVVSTLSKTKGRDFIN